MQVKDEILARMYVMLTLFSLVPLAVGMQVVRVGLYDTQELRTQGENQSNLSKPIPAMRGSIVDRLGRTLVANTSRYDVGVDPTEIGFEARSGELLQTLSRTTNTSVNEYRARIRNRASPRYVLLERGVDEVARVRIETLDVPGVIVDARFRRRYNHGQAAAHVLGHVNADLAGMAGIEKAYNSFLAGKPGRRAMQRDMRGQTKASAGGLVIEPQHGETIVLTIDLVRQTVLEEELARGVRASGAQWGTALAMDPRTGALLALASYPTYDPNRPSAYPPGNRRNHGVADRIEPGSTFKLVTAVAAIESGAVAMEDTIDTGPGWAVIHGRTLKDTHAHGRIPFLEVISLSSNIGTARVAERLERGTLYQYARRLGFGTATWIDLPSEVPGTLKRISSWSRTTKSAMSRGYEVEATPLQILTAYSALANGGMLVKPYVVAERRDVMGRVTWTASRDSVRRAFDRETARRILPAFERVVTAGTARKAALEGLPVAGKTGTAMKTRNGSYEAGAYRASFVGFFPSDAPEVVMLIVMDEPKTSIYGGSVAAPVFRETARRWLATLPNVAARLSADTTAAPKGRPLAPELVDVPTTVAARRARAAGLNPRISGKRDATALVVEQHPASGAPTLETPIRLISASREATLMPDLRGLSTRDATYWLTVRGVRTRVEGQGVVQTQSPSPGAPMPQRAVLRSK